MTQINKKGYRYIFNTKEPKIFFHEEFINVYFRNNYFVFNNCRFRERGFKVCTIVVEGKTERRSEGF